jgi:hypothetical protein
MSKIIGVERVVVDYWGGCPRCGKNDGCVTVGREHFYVCDEHRVRWCVGANLFSSWREMSEEDHRKNWKRLSSYRDVEPLGEGVRLIRADHAPRAPRRRIIEACEASMNAISRSDRRRRGTMDLRSIARALGGEVSGSQVLAPGPGHSPKDRSLSVWLCPAAPDGFRTHSHVSDPWPECRDFVRDRLGLPADGWKRAHRRSEPPRRPIAGPAKAADDDAKRIADALSLWAAGVDPRGTMAERYLASRSLELGDDVAGAVLRWHSGIRAMLALFRSIKGDEPRAVSRRYLDPEGNKLGRKFLGPVGGAAIKLDTDENVLSGLHIGEGVETCMSARQLGMRPTWALGSAGAIAAFPVLSGVEYLTLLGENDDTSACVVETCATRWHAAGRAVLITRAVGGKDLNDAIRRPT